MVYHVPLPALAHVTTNHCIIILYGCSCLEGTVHFAFPVEAVVGTHPILGNGFVSITIPVYNVQNQVLSINSIIFYLKYKYHKF